MLDGVGYVVELAIGGIYRTYLVSNPQSDRTENGDRFLSLLPVLYTAFGVTLDDGSDLSKLPNGQTRTVTSVASEEPPGPFSDADPWPPGTEPDASFVAGRLTASQALASAQEIQTPGCGDIPLLFRYSRTARVAVEVRIRQDGTVSDARALSGPPLLRKLTVDFARRWQFAPSPSGGRPRQAILLVAYDQKWISFPWLR